MNEDYINVSVQHIKVPILKYIHLKKHIYIIILYNIHTDKIEEELRYCCAIQRLDYFLRTVPHQSKN